MRREYPWKHAAVQALSSDFQFASRLSSATISTSNDIASHSSEEAKSVTVSGQKSRIPGLSVAKPSRIVTR
jgi:hypothetical protein